MRILGGHYQSRSLSGASQLSGQRVDGAPRFAPYLLFFSQRAEQIGRARRLPHRMDTLIECASLRRPHGGGHLQLAIDDAIDRRSRRAPWYLGEVQTCLVAPVQFFSAGISLVPFHCDGLWGAPHRRCSPSPCAARAAPNPSKTRPIIYVIITIVIIILTPRRLVVFPQDPRYGMAFARAKSFAPKAGCGPPPQALAFARMGPR